MTKLRISADLALPPEVVTSTLVVYGGKGDVRAADMLFPEGLR